MISNRVCALFLFTSLVAVADGQYAQAADSVDKGSIRSGNVEVFARFPHAQPSGIAVLSDGRMVLGFPRSVHEHQGPRLALYLKGKLTPFPDAASQQAFVSPLGMTVDAHGTLWVLDEGMVDGKGAIAGAQKLFEIDPVANKIVKTYTVTAPALLLDSHLNDVRVDLTHGAAGTAFITDNSMGVHPGIVVIDLATGTQRRVLADSRFVSAEPGFAGMVDGVLARYDLEHPAFPQGGVDGIALSVDQKTLYWQSLSSRKLYSASTSALSDPKLSPSTLESLVKYEGETAMGDGMATGPDGSLYITDIERHGIVKRTPDGHISIVAHDDRMIEPDGLFFHDGVLYNTIGQWARLPAFRDGKEMEEMPYVIMKITPPN